MYEKLKYLLIGIVIGVVICAVIAVPVMTDARVSLLSCNTFNDELYAKWKGSQDLTDTVLDGWDLCLKREQVCYNGWDNCRNDLQRNIEEDW